MLTIEGSHYLQQRRLKEHHRTVIFPERDSFEDIPFYPTPTPENSKAPSVIDDEQLDTNEVVSEREAVLSESADSAMFSIKQHQGGIFLFPAREEGVVKRIVQVIVGFASCLHFARSHPERGRRTLEQLQRKRRRAIGNRGSSEGRG